MICDKPEILNPHETQFPKDLVTNPKTEAKNPKFKGYPARSQQMAARIRQRKEMEKNMQSDKQSEEPARKVQFEKVAVDAPKINTISLITKENFIGPNKTNTANTAVEHAEVVSSSRTNTAQFETIRPQNEEILIEDSQIVFTESYPVHTEIEVETDETKLEHDERKSDPISDTVNTCRRQDTHSAALKPFEKILRMLKIMEYISALIKKPRLDLGVTEEIDQPITNTVQTGNPDTTQSVSHEVTTENRTPIDAEHTQEINVGHSFCAVDNTDDEESSLDLSQNAIQFATSSDSLLIEGSIGNRKFSFLIDTGTNVSALNADLWRQLPPPTKHPPEPVLDPPLNHPEIDNDTIFNAEKILRFPTEHNLVRNRL